MPKKKSASPRAASSALDARGQSGSRRRSAVESSREQTAPRSVVLNSVAVIGAGNWGTALACAVASARAEQGLTLREVVVRDPHDPRNSVGAQVVGKPLRESLRGKWNPQLVVDWDAARLDAEFLWLCVPDDAIESVCAELVARRRIQVGQQQAGSPPTKAAKASAFGASSAGTNSTGAGFTRASSAGIAARRVTAAKLRAEQSRGVLAGQIVLHSSGACESALLAEAQKAGAQIASVHPVMSFPRREPVSLEGLLYGVETASADCRRRLGVFLRKLGGEPFPVASGSKHLYHAAGTLASPLLLSTFAAAVEAAQLAGLGKAQAARVVGRLAEATLANAQSKGVAASLSGPLARGDAGTVALHLQALSEHPPLEEVYRALTAYALGHWPVRRAKDVAARLAETIKSRQPQKRQRSESPLTRKKRR